MNICLIAKALPVHFIGGMEVHTQSLIDGLLKNGHKLTIISTLHPNGLETEERDNLKIYFIGDKSMRCTEKFYKQSIELFDRLQTNEQFDIIHSQSTSGYGIIKHGRGRIPFVATFHGTSWNEVKSALNTRSTKMFAKALYIFCRDILLKRNKEDVAVCKFADKIIAVSNELKDDLKSQYGVEDEILLIIPNGIDTAIFMPNLNVDGLIEKYNLKNTKIVLSAGVVTGQKGQDLLIKILPDLLKRDERIKLILIGKGPAMPDLKRKADAFGVSRNIIFAGMVPHEKMQYYYNLADVFVLPTFRLEGDPLVVSEAMACGKPVVASRIGGIPTVIDDYKNGLLIEPGNTKELINKIIEVLENNELSDDLSKQAREKVVANYSVDNMVRRIITVYQTLAK
jgi:glycosyltransferase involved in cell wall biosynthesis